MSRIVACHHCGAPHRPVRGQTRYTCEWCGGENVHASTHRGPEVLVIDGPCESRVARERALDLLRRRGVEGAVVAAAPARWTACWQVVGEDGESVEQCGRRDASRLEMAMGLPTAAFRPVLDGDDVPDRPELELDEILASARAGFDDSDQSLSAVRLVWIQVCDLRVRTRDGDVEGLYVGGADDVVLAPLPAGAASPLVEPVRVARWAGFAVIAMATGALLDDPWLRAFVLGGMLVVATALPWGVGRKVAR